jgi:GNAT superfamily N-acetyltransferase
VSGPAEAEASAARVPVRARVRTAGARDAVAVARAVRALLVELGGTPPPEALMEAAARAVIVDGEAGAVLVADDADGTLVGVLAANWPLAIHTGGSYGLIQDLWVDPAWRSVGTGAELVEAFCEEAARRGASRVEVGIPRDSFPRLEATRRFYERRGFDVVGARMRRRTA